MISADQQIRFQDESKQVLKALVLWLLKPKPILMLLHLSMKRPTSWVEFFNHLYYQRPHFRVASFHWQRRNPHMYIVQCTFASEHAIIVHTFWVSDRFCIFVYLACIWNLSEWKRRTRGGGGGMFDPRPLLLFHVGKCNVLMWKCFFCNRSWKTKISWVAVSQNMINLVKLREKCGAMRAGGCFVLSLKLLPSSTWPHWCTCTTTHRAKRDWGRSHEHIVHIYI